MVMITGLPIVRRRLAITEEGLQKKVCFYGLELDVCRQTADDNAGC
ncbi:hypothetical protein [Stieleria neptunia]|nr:hypothetical protein [Stieleria neptunia]